MGEREREAAGARIRNAAGTVRKTLLTLEGLGQEAFDEVARAIERYVVGKEPREVPRDRSFGASYEVPVGPVVFRLERKPMALIPKIGPSNPIAVRVRLQTAPPDEWTDIEEVRLARGKWVGRSGPIPDGALADHILNLMVSLLEG